jgi:hypothetical protein
MNSAFHLSRNCFFALSAMNHIECIKKFNLIRKVIMQRQSHFKSAKILGGALFISTFLGGCGGDASTTLYPAPTLTPPESNFTINETNAAVLSRQTASTIDGLRRQDGGLAPAILALIVNAAKVQNGPSTKVGENKDFSVPCSYPAGPTSGTGTLKGTITLTGNPKYPATGNKYELVAKDCLDSSGKYKFNGNISVTIDVLTITVLSDEGRSANRFFGPTYNDSVVGVPPTGVSPAVDAPLNFGFPFAAGAAYSIAYGFSTSASFVEFSIAPTSGTALTRTYNGQLKASFSKVGQSNTNTLPVTNFELKNGGGTLTIADGVTTQTLSSFNLTGVSFNNIQNQAKVTAIYNVTGSTSAKASDGTVIGDFAYGVQTSSIPLNLLLDGSGNNSDAQFRSGEVILKTFNKSNLLLSAVDVANATIKLDQDGNSVFEKTLKITW